MADGNYLVGVDIGSSAIKLCQLKDIRGKKTLVKFGYHALPPQTIVDGHVQNAAAIVEGLNQLFNQHKIKRREVALAVSGHAVIIKKMALPMMTNAELDEQIDWEAEQQIPYDIKDVQIDYEVLRKRPEQGQMDVLLVAAKKEEINEAAQIARDAKLKPLVIDVDAFTVQNAFEANYGLPREGTVALINIGATLTTINILSQGIPSFTRNIINGGNAITEEIQKQMGISTEEADAYKVGGSAGEMGVVPQEVVRIIDGVAEVMAGEFQRSLDFFLATTAEANVTRVCLAGGTAKVGALHKAIERRSRLPIEVVDSWRRVEIDPSLDRNYLAAHSSEALIGLGLALRAGGDR